IRRCARCHEPPGQGEILVQGETWTQGCPKSPRRSIGYLPGPSLTGDRGTLSPPGREGQVPEGDVLRLTADRLDQALRGSPLVRAELRWPSAAGADLVGRTVTSCTAYGKHVLTRLDDGRTLHTHLRMDGSWRVERTGGRAAAARRPEIRAVLATTRWTCVGWRLGMLDLLRTRDEPHLLAHLGPDVLADDFPGDGLDEAVRRMREQGPRPLCDVLLDQGVVAGLGTIWMAESLYASRLW